MNEYNRLYIRGDTHGRFDFLPYFCMSHETTKKDLLIILGDVGINYYGGENDALLKEVICMNDITLLCLRGNHEMRPSDVKGMVEIDYCGARAYIEYEYPNIIYAKDGEIYDINGGRFLTIGGAYSVDKWYRLEMGRQWFANEQLSKEERAQILDKVSGQEVDFILTHTCPLQFQPTELFLQGLDESTIDKEMEIWLTEVEEKVWYGNWLFGHYHADKQIAPGVSMLYNSIIELINSESEGSSRRERR